MNGNDMITTIIHIGDEVYDKIDEIIIVDRLKKIIEELVKRIKQKLNNSDDIFLKYAYEHADILHSIVQYHPVNEGGSHRNGKIYIGERGFKNSEMGSDDDIMATIFHEFMHYITFKLKIYPKRYENVEEGIIYSEKVSKEDALETNDEFLQRAYESFILNKYTVDFDKYAEYPSFYIELNEDQKKEVQDYINTHNLKAEIQAKYFTYIPSNHNKDEINAHKKTLEVQEKGIFNMSSAKLDFYELEIKRYTELYDRAIEYEHKNGYSPDGYKN